jgi:DNA modification methylase
MTPYYEEKGITIYHGDCREILPTLKADLLLTDPPYGIGRDGKRPSTSKKGGGHKGYAFLGWDDAIPCVDTFSAMFTATNHQIIWGGNYFADRLPASMGWLVWDKGQRIAQSDGELCFTSFQKALRIFEMNRMAIQQDGAVHPAQKPVALIKWCIQQAPDTVKTILDPFMGSGTTLVAAKDLGLSAIGIEREEKYCEIAVNRLRQNVFEF